MHYKYSMSICEKTLAEWRTGHYAANPAQAKDLVLALDVATRQLAWTEVIRLSGGTPQVMKSLISCCADELQLGDLLDWGYYDGKAVVFIRNIAVQHRLMVSDWLSDNLIKVTFSHKL